MFVPLALSLAFAIHDEEVSEKVDLTRNELDKDDRIWPKMARERNEYSSAEEKRCASFPPCRYATARSMKKERE